MYDHASFMSGYDYAPPAPSTFGGAESKIVEAGGALALLGGALAISAAGLVLGGWAGWAIAGHFAAPVAVQWASAVVGALLLNPWRWWGALRRALT